VYLALDRGRPCFPPDFSCPVVLGILPQPLVCAYGSLTLFPRLSQTVRLQRRALLAVPQPRHTQCRFRLLGFRSPLLAESFPLLGLLRCFTSPGSLPLRDAQVLPRAGFPIRTPPAACGCTHLAGAFRRVPRPSSARDPKASTRCPYLLLLCDRESMMLL
jgi:hypothetical protein